MPNEDGTPTPEEVAAQVAAQDAEAAAQQAMRDEEAAAAAAAALPGDRPALNVLQEMRRRDERTQKQIADMMAMLASMQQTAARPAPAATTEYTDQQLEQLADQGNVQATRMLAQRDALRVNQQAAQAQQVLTQAQARVAELVGMYPALRDGNSPLAQEALRRKQGLLQSGAYQGLHPELANLLATVQAIQDACTYAPDLAQQARAPGLAGPAGLEAAEAARQSAVRTQQGMQAPGPPRRQPPPGKAGEKPYEFTKEEKALAARMNIADPSKAMRGFLKRHETGRSAVNPNALGIIREQGDDKRFL